MPKYVALLRGINVGGRTLKMDALRKMFEREGYADVKTLLASGNVVFSAKDASADKVRTKIEQAIKDEFKMDVHVILRSEKEIAALVKADPFKGVKPGKEIRFYLTFLTALTKVKLEASHRKNGIHAIGKDYVVTVLSPGVGTPDHMDYLVKNFGSQITTRNWNTVMKIHKAIQA